MVEVTEVGAEVAVAGVAGAGGMPGRGGIDVIAYIVRRLAQSVIVIFGVTVIVFVIVHLLPGGPRALLGPRVSPAVVHAFIVANGYNHPLYIQYGDYVGHLVQGNLGFSYTYNEPVLTLLQPTCRKAPCWSGWPTRSPWSSRFRSGCCRRCGATSRSTTS